LKIAEKSKEAKFNKTLVLGQKNLTLAQVTNQKSPKHVSAEQQQRRKADS
jgi:hypothetical protein